MKAHFAPKPNFFIIGAPKCGTTALSEYLRSHPSVLISEPKEPHYFSTDIDTRYAIRDLEGYRACYAGASAAHQLIGEACFTFSRQWLCPRYWNTHQSRASS